MGKTIVLNLSTLELRGDILDIGNDNNGVIYNIKKYSDIEIVVDCVSEPGEITNSNYDICIMFFTLGKINNNKMRQELIEQIYPFLREDGELYVWDIYKKKNEIYNKKIRVIMPGEKIKEFFMRDGNLLKEWTADIAKKNLEQSFDVLETKEWEDIFFIKLKKKGRETNEDFTDSNQLEIHSQQSGREILEDFYGGFKLSRGYKRIFNK
ncbi:MAG: hypothetical protein ABRQ25_06615 [Clostridiaceae bacterium]